MPDNIPGITALEETVEGQIWAIGPDGQHKRFQQKIHIKSTVTDAGNTAFTSTLRPGLALARKDSDSLDYLYSPSANDGTQGCTGLLEKAVSMIRNGVATDRFTWMLTSGIIRNLSDLVGVDKQAMATLLRIGFTIAQPTPHGSAFLLHPWRTDFKSADYTVLDADHGKMLVATGAVNFTLPSLATVGAGYEVLLYNGADNTMVVTAPVADTILFGDAGGGPSTTLTFSTANKKAGGQVLMRSGYDGGGTPALKWYSLFPVGATSA